MARELMLTAAKNFESACDIADPRDCLRSITVGLTQMANCLANETSGANMYRTASTNFTSSTDDPSQNIAMKTMALGLMQMARQMKKDKD